MGRHDEEPSAIDAREVALRFGLGEPVDLVGPVARGELGQVWRLTTEQGAWAVKESFGQADPAGALADAGYSDAVRTAGVRIPTVCRTRDGDVLVAAGPRQIRVYGWVDLDPPDRGVDPVAVGELVAAIHRVHHPHSGAVDGWYTDPVGAASWDDLIRRLRTGRAGAADRLAALRDELVALEHVLERPARLPTCHRDLFADNVRTTPSGSLCVIDWENCGPQDPCQELAVVLFEFGCGAGDRVRTLYRAYRAAGGPATVGRRGDFSMLIAQLGHIGELACRAWLEAPDPTQRDHHAARVSEFLDDPLTRDVIDRMLDAVT